MGFSFKKLRWDKLPYTKTVQTKETEKWRAAG